MEASMKMARQYYLEMSPPQLQRSRFIARKGSYHGTTLGALSMSGHIARRAPYLPMLLNNVSRVSACNAYRDMMEGETNKEYVARLAEELDERVPASGTRERVCLCC